MKLCFYACRFLFFVALSPGPHPAIYIYGPAFFRLQKAERGPGNKATFFDCKGFRVVLDSAVTGMTFLIGLTSFPVRHGKPGLMPENKNVY